MINILKKELKELFRDKKSLSMMLVIPIFIPLLIIGLSALFNMENNKPIEEYNKIGFNYKLSDIEKELANQMSIEVIESDTDTLKSDFDKDNIDLYVIKNDNNYELNGDDSETTIYAMALVKSFFNSYKEYLQSEFLINKNISSNDVINIINVSENIISEDGFYARYIITYGFLFIIMAITVSATYPATDTTAGEKERGTLETLLTFPIKSSDIIMGKFLSVTFSSFITGIISLILMIISLFISNHSFMIYKDSNLMLSTSSIIYSIFVIFAYSFLISGLCISIATKSKTFKEAQSALTPLTFISFFPSMIAFMIDIKSNYLLSLVPFLNFTLLFEDITSGSISLVNIILMLSSTIFITLLILKIIIKQYKSENILF